ncbi:hypothetical protein Bca4012_027256 [Brassica carinata]
MISFQGMRERAKQEAGTGKAEEKKDKPVFNVKLEKLQRRSSYKRSESLYEFGSQGIEGACDHANNKRTAKGSAKYATSERSNSNQIRCAIDDDDALIPDAAIWNTTGFDPVQNQKFSARKVSNLIRDSKPVVPWKNTVWLKKGIPKFKTLTWLFVLDRCPTRNRLISWGLQTDDTCLLCNQEPESRHHLYFCCDYSFAIWGTIARNLNFVLQSNSWNATLESLSNLLGDSHLRYITILAWQASIFELWKERNNRLHRRVYRSSPSLISSISTIIKNRISSLREDNQSFSC